MAIDIIYFDYWTRGIRHFSNIDSDLKSQGFDTMLVHLGSQRDERYERDVELSGIKCRDLKYYNNSLVAMLKSVSPRVVLLLNNQTEDKILVRACRNLGIKTIYLMHGALVPHENINEVVDLIDSAFDWRDRLARIPKYFRLFREYLRSAALKNSSSLLDFEIYSYFFRLAISPGASLYSEAYRYRDSQADYALVYSFEDKDFLCSFYGYRPYQVEVVGNYNLDEMFSSDTINARKKEFFFTEKYCVYVENGFSDPKYPIHPWTEELVADEVTGISNVCKDYGYKLVLKLHPSSDYSNLIDILESESNVDIVSNCNIVELIEGADFIIGQSSTLLMMALVAKKLILIPDISPLNLKISTYFKRGFGLKFCSFEDLRSLMNESHLDFLQNEGKSKAIKYFLGPTDGHSSGRISSFLAQLLK